MVIRKQEDDLAQAKAIVDKAEGGGIVTYLTGPHPLTSFSQKNQPVGSYRLRKNSTHTEVDYRISDQLYTLACHSGISRLLYIASKQT